MVDADRTFLTGAAPSKDCESNSASTTAGTMTARPRWSLRLGALACSFGFCLVLLEVGLRLVGYRPHVATALSTFFRFDAETGWSGRPNVDARFATASFHSRVVHGPDGRRGTIPSTRSTQQVQKTVWCVGDSMTWGWGVSEGETFVDLLNQRTRDGREFVNLGCPGYSALQEYLLCKHLLERGETCDHILVFFIENDLRENLDDDDQDPPRPYCVFEDGQVVMRNYPTRPSRNWGLRSWLGRTSRAYSLLHFQAVTLRNALRNWRGSGIVQVPPPPTSAEIQVLTDIYRQFQDLCRRHRVRLSIVYIPNAAEIGGPHGAALLRHDRHVCRLVGGVVRDLGIPFVDLTPAFERFRREAPNSQLTFRYDPHLNREGHRIVAEALHQALYESAGVMAN